MKFKAGDKVRILRSMDIGIKEIYFMIGKTSEVISVLDNVSHNQKYQVRCLIKPADHWFFTEDELELVAEKSLAEQLDDLSKRIESNTQELKDILTQLKGKI